jgi:hypothetical protein
MASSDNRPASSGAWQPGSQAEAAAGTAVVESPAWPSHDLARRQTRPPEKERGADQSSGEMTGAASAVQQTAAALATPPPGAAAEPVTGTQGPGAAPGQAASTPGAVAQSSSPAAQERRDPASPETTPTAARAAATETTPAPATQTTPTAAPAPATVAATTAAPSTAADPAAELRGRKSTFMADLTRAMRVAADDARQSTLAQFQADVDRHMDTARSTIETAAADARRRADEDVAALGEWEKAEMARIRAETEQGITARHGRLETELAEQSARLDQELRRVRQRVDTFNAEMDAFFQRLLLEEDPARFAGMAEQLPEPPAFTLWSADAPAAPRKSPPEGPASRGIRDASAPGRSDNSGPRTDEPTGMPAMKPDDFAAAEAEAADWVATSDGPDAATEASAPTDAPPAGATAAETAAASGAATDAKTQVAVVGLVSVASIAAFKRLLGRVPGVRAVQVASGPDGEFVFAATHDATVDMPAAVKGLQGFEVELVQSGPGVVNARAVDPEVV